MLLNRTKWAMNYTDAFKQYKIELLCNINELLELGIIYIIINFTARNNLIYFFNLTQYQHRGLINHN